MSIVPVPPKDPIPSVDDPEFDDECVGDPDDDVLVVEGDGEAGDVDASDADATDATATDTDADSTRSRGRTTTVPTRSPSSN